MKVLKSQLPELASAIGIGAPASESVRTYIAPDASKGERYAYDGNSAWVGSQIKIAPPVDAVIYFGLTFERGESDERHSSKATFIFSNYAPKIHDKMKIKFHGSNHYYFWDDPKECGFAATLMDPLMIEAEFRTMLDHAIAEWRKIGGWMGLEGVSSPDER
jgi:hypothetical protein